MDIIIDFPDGLKVNAQFAGQTIKTDQPVQGGGEGSAPTPFALFLSSIGTCAGIYVLGFCRQRGLPTDNIRIVQRLHSRPMSSLIGQIDLEIQVPPEFPEKYRESLVRSANLCAVKKHLETPPEFNVYTEVVS